MKHFISGTMIALALILALVMGVAAMAETVEPEAPEMPGVGPTQPEAEADGQSESTELQDALKAYDAARESSRQEDLEAELKGYVEAGKLTQAQADLILNSFRERQALRDGTCPSCGYAFRNGDGMQGRMNGGRGGRGRRGMGGRQPMNGQPQVNAWSQAFGELLPDAQLAPDMGVAGAI